MNIVIRIAISLVVGGFITKICVIFRDGIIPSSKSKKLLQEAVAKNHVVVGHLKDVGFSSDAISSGSVSNYTGIYEYCVDSKKYKYYYCTNDTPPEEIQLYYLDNPAKACDAENIGKHKGWFKFFLIASAIVFALISLFK